MAETQQAYLRPWERFNRRFEAQYGEGHALFVCHAVFPVILTPDLLYQIWFNFRTYESSSGDWRFMDAMVVSDLLLSGLMKEVGHERYEVVPGLRAYLLDKLNSDPRFGAARLQTLAAFLRSYATTRQTTEEDMGLRQVWNWTADATLDPSGTARQLATRMGAAFQDQLRPQQLQISLLLDQIGDGNSALQELKTLAQGVINPEAVTDLPGFRISHLPSDNDVFRIPLPPALSRRLQRPGLPLDQARDLAWRLAEARNATKIDLSNFDLEELPEEMQELTHLEEIDLKNNRLKELPPWLSLFTRLKRLRLSRNRLTDFLYSEGGLPALEELTINNNGIRHFPPSLFACPCLIKLLMTRNGLEALPEGISRISRLEHLDVGSNRIPALPEDLGEIQGLRQLYVNDNLLKDIPESLARAVRLEILQAHNNQLSALPPALLNLGSNLLPNDHNNPWRRGLRLEGNRFPGLYAEGFWQSSPVALINQLSELTPLPEEGTKGFTVFLSAFAPESEDAVDEKQATLLAEIEAIRVWLGPLEAQHVRLETSQHISLGALTDSFEEAATQQFPVTVWHHGSFVDGLGGLYETRSKASPDPFEWITGQRDLRLVFLNTCDSLPDAERLFRSGIPSVIGIEGQIPNDAAIEFAQQFYRKLAAGEALQAAFDHTQDYMLSWGTGSGMHRSIGSESNTQDWNYRHVLLATKEMQGWRLVEVEGDSWLVQRSGSGLILNKGANDGIMQGLMLGTNGFELTGEVTTVGDETSIVDWENFYSSEEQTPVFPFSIPSTRLSYGFFGSESSAWQTQLGSYFRSRPPFIDQLSQRTDETGLVIETDGKDWWVNPPGSGGIHAWKMPFNPEKDLSQTAKWLAFIARYYVLQQCRNPFSDWATNIEIWLKTDQEELFGGPISQGLFFPDGVDQFSSLEIINKGSEAKWASLMAIEGQGRIRALHAEALPVKASYSLEFSSGLVTEKVEGLLVLFSETPVAPLLLAQDPINGNLATKTSFLDADSILLNPDWQLIYLPFPPKPELA